jgi:cation:H+ antiporter
LNIVLYDFLLSAAGLVILVLAGDALVRGAVNLALRLGIPALVVGLTIVAFGTSAPELLVSVQAVLKDAPGIALGNVVGSNIANILLVLGIPALISGLHAGESDTRRSYLTMLAATLVFIVLSFVGPITWWHAVILLIGLAAMLTDSYFAARRHKSAATSESEELEGADAGMPTWKIAMFLALGLVGLPLGADLLVDGSVNIARTFGVSETVIGLTLVAIGTSLPELATTVIAAIKRETDVALGNVIGSNVFNLLGIIGIAGLVGPLQVPEVLLSRDLWVMLVASLLIAPMVFYGIKLGRGAGLALLGAYSVYLFAIIS